MNILIHYIVSLKVIFKVTNYVHTYNCYSLNIKIKVLDALSLQRLGLSF